MKDEYMCIVIVKKDQFFLSDFILQNEVQISKLQELRKFDSKHLISYFDYHYDMWFVQRK